MCMRLIFLVFLISWVFIAASIFRLMAMQPPLKNKPAPVYKTMDPKLAPIVHDYKAMAKKHDIKFTHDATIGFTDIHHDDVVGICNYGTTWREIDLDRAYWKKLTERQQRELAYHELSHCYCLRKHDYEAGGGYAEPKRASLVRSEKPPFFFISAGFFVDGCPTSIMYPYVLGDSCIKYHAKHYQDEMFERCTPY